MSQQGHSTPPLSENAYTYNGKELNTDFGIALHDFGARQYDAANGRWTGIDPLAEQFSVHSPYCYAVNNPVLMIDPDGRAATLPSPNPFGPLLFGLYDDLSAKENERAMNRAVAKPLNDYIFDEKGNFVREDKNTKPHRIVIEHSQTKKKMKVYDFNDADEDAQYIGLIITQVVFQSHTIINDEVSNKNKTSENRWKYIERESRPKDSKSIFSGISAGQLDYAGTSKLLSSNVLHLVDFQNRSNGIAYNHFDFGNFLWGHTGGKMGFSLGTLLSAAHFNNATVGRRQNNVPVGVFDSPADQAAIRAGYFYPNFVPLPEKYVPTMKELGRLKPWENKF